MRPWLVWLCILVVAEIAAGAVGLETRAPIATRLIYVSVPLVLALLVGPYVCLFHAWYDDRARALGYTLAFGPWVAIAAAGTFFKVNTLSRVVVHGRHVHPSYVATFVSIALPLVMMFLAPKALARLSASARRNAPATQIAMGIVAMVAPNVVAAHNHRSGSQSYSGSQNDNDHGRADFERQDKDAANYRDLHKYQDDTRKVQQAADDARQREQQRQDTENLRRQQDEAMRRRY